jgi:hypothetical protein
MKTISKITFVFALVAFANTSFALRFSNLRVDLLPISAESAVVEISTFTNSNFKITVVDNKDRIVFSNENAEPIDNYRVQYDHSNLPDGVYKLTVVSGDLTTERSFRKTLGAIKVGKEKMMIKPFFGYKNGLVRCAYLNFPKEYLTLYLLKKDQLLYTKDLGKTFNMSEAINLSQLDVGSYTAVLSAGGKEYSYQIDKK